MLGYVNTGVKNTLGGDGGSVLCYDPHCTEGAAASGDVKFIDLRHRSAPPAAQHLRGMLVL